MIRRWKVSVIMMLICAFLVTGCGGDKKKKEEDVTTTENQATEATVEEKVEEPILAQVLKLGMEIQEEERRDYITMKTTIARPYLIGEDASNYAALQASLDQYYQNEAAQRDGLYDEMISNAEVLMVEGGLYGRVQDVNFIDSKPGVVIRADSNILSIEIPYQVYHGGLEESEVHGSEGLNYDSKTGAELNFSDVVNNGEKFFGLVDEKLRTKYPDEYAAFNQEAITKLKSEMSPEIGWTVSQEGVTVYFPTNYLNSESFENHNVTVLFDDAPEIFTDKCKGVSKDYTMPYDSEKDFWIDADGDGDKEQVQVEKIEQEPTGEYGYSYKFNVVLDGKTVQIDTLYGDYMDCDIYIVRANGQYYLYICEEAYFDYHILHVIDLKTMAYDSNMTTLVDVTPNMTSGTEFVENATISYADKYVFADPTSFVVDYNSEIMFIGGKLQNCHVNGEGYLEPDEGYYEMTTDTILKVLQSITCNQVDEAGKVIQENVELKEGQYLYFVRLDGKNWVDVQLVDETKVVTGEEAGYGVLYSVSEEIIAFDSQQPIYRLSCVREGDVRSDTLIDGSSAWMVLDGFNIGEGF